MKVDSKRTIIKYQIRFTKAEIETLTDGSRSHYDGVCRLISEKGWLAIAATQMKAFETEEFITYLGWRDLDVLSKICESPLVAESVAHDVWQIFRELRADTENTNGASS